jgi:glutathione S-transferase/RNA polymerase-associated protein
MAMKLIDNPLSPYSLKVRMILYEKGIDFEKSEIHTEDQREELLRANPRAEVPALVDGDTVVYDSKVIAEYIEERFPNPPLLPADPAGRARCRHLELVADTEVDAAVVVFSMFKFFRPELAERMPEALDRATALLRGQFGKLERELAGREYLAGAFSRADLAFAPHFGAAAFMGLAPGADTPNLAAWLARVNARESVQRASQEAVACVGQKYERPIFDPHRLHWRSDRIEQLIRVGMGPWLLEELARDRAFLPPE